MQDWRHSAAIAGCSNPPSRQNAGCRELGAGHKLPQTTAPAPAPAATPSPTPFSVLLLLLLLLILVLLPLGCGNEKNKAY